MTNFRELEPGLTDRAAFIGQTGSGKTTAARYILEQRPYCVAYDPKGQLDWKGWEIHGGGRRTDFGTLCRSDAPRLIYKPTYRETRDPLAIEAFFAWVYQRRNITVYVDELYVITNGPEYPWWYGACLTRGRELGVSVFSATQRPSRIPQVCLSESEYYFVFYLKLGQDRERVEQLTGIDRDRIQHLEKHHFYFAPQSGVPQGPLTLSLPSEPVRGNAQNKTAHDSRTV
jgi:hypothetical protein